LNALQDATTKAVSIMQAACPDETPLTPTGRLEAIPTRPKAMIDAANTVKPSLDSLYASLSSEQEARFSRISQELAQSRE
jgi:LTXXQ motif family protein